MKKIINIGLLTFLFMCTSCKEDISEDSYRLENNSPDNVELIFFYKGTIKSRVNVEPNQTGWIIQNAAFEGRKRTICNPFPAPFLLRDNDSAYLIRNAKDTTVYYKTSPTSACAGLNSILCETEYLLESEVNDGNSCVYTFELN